MANAFGGPPLGDVRREGIKYEKERLDDSRKMKLRTTIDRPMTRTELERLANKVSGLKSPAESVSRSLRNPASIRYVNRTTTAREEQGGNGNSKLKTYPLNERSVSRDGNSLESSRKKEFE